MKGLEHLSYGERLSRNCAAWRRGSGRVSSTCTNTWRKAAKEDGARLCSFVPSEKTRGDGHQLKHRMVHLNVRKLFRLWGWLNPERVWSLPPWKHGTRQPALGGLAWAEAGPGEHQKSPPTSSILWFCDIHFSLTPLSHQHRTSTAAW